MHRYVGRRLSRTECVLTLILAPQRPHQTSPCNNAAPSRGAPCVVIQGEDELARGEVMIKDLVEGARLSEEIEDNVEWREGHPAPFAVSEGELAEAVRKVLARHEG